MPKLNININTLAVIWIICSFVAWGTYLGHQNIGIIGIITWVVSICGIIAFIWEFMVPIFD